MRSVVCLVRRLGLRQPRVVAPVVIFPGRPWDGEVGAAELADQLAGKVGAAELE